MADPPPTSPESRFPALGILGAHPQSQLPWAPEEQVQPSSLIPGHPGKSLFPSSILHQQQLQHELNS